MMEVAGIKITSPVVLAPMAGITNLAYREFAKSFGVGLTYTEMVSDCGLIYGNVETFKYIETSPKDRPVAIQLFGGTKETLLRGLKKIESLKDDYDFIDINLGCPVPKVTKTGAGSAWLLRLEELSEMMKEVINSSQKPVTAKIRIGWDYDSINVYQVVEVLQNAGVSLIAVHPRTKSQLYSGKAHYEVITDLKKIMKVPLVISGDINSLEQAIKLKELTGADGLMLGRGALGNPFLITQINHYYQTGEILADVSLEENVRYMLQHTKKLIALKGEKIAIKEMRGLAPKYLAGFSKTKDIRAKLATQMSTYEDMEKILKQEQLIK